MALRKGEVYKGFEVLDAASLPEFSAQGIWLRHRETGMEVFHLLNDDEENLFAFAFKTPPRDSTGVAHILEHSVLCGSRNYPLKDPFIRLANQSVKTFLNAMTFSDKTVYPAASISSADYFNLMAVYGDAVFFPLLEEWTFNQEGHRLELDDQGRPSIQGVVYNEMKGNYSSFENVAGDWCVRSVLPGTVYDLDSGGDPVEIPLLSYRDFVQFHREHYNPGNCRLFLAGNIPTRKQLDFICDRFLDCYDRTVAELASGRASSPDNHPGPPRRSLLPLDCPPPTFRQPVVMERPGPGGSGGGDDCGATVTLTWFAGDSSSPMDFMETVLVAEILVGHDGSPLSQALLESGLGEDLAPNCGIDSEMHWVLMTVGLRGCRRDKAEEVERLVFSVLEAMVRDGVRREDIEAAVLSVDFAQREVRRVNGPYSLILMRRCLRGWLYGHSPYRTISNRSAFQTIKERIAGEPGYVEGLIRRLLIENSHRSRVTVYPHQGFAERMQERERELVRRLMADVSPDEIKERHRRLVEFQRQGTEEDASILPHISPRDLDPDVDSIGIQRTEGPGGVPVFVSREPTNGVVYLSLCFPVDLLDPEDYPLLPFLAGTLANVGFGETGWVEAARRSALEIGTLGASLLNSSMMNGHPGRQALDGEGRLVEDVLFGRDWLFVRAKMLSEQTEKALALVRETILTVDFSDAERLATLAREYRNDFIASLAPNGHEYAASRTTRRLGRNKAVDEIWNGLVQLPVIRGLVDGDMTELGRRLGSLFGRIRASGAAVHVTADGESLDSALPLVRRFVTDCGLEPPRPRLHDHTETLMSMTRLPGDDSPDSLEADCQEEGGGLELLPGDFQVGFAAAACRGKGYDDDECVYQGVLAHWLSNTALWEQIRVVGGAYGAFAWPDTAERAFAFASYRDPKPLRSLGVFRQALAQAAEEPMDDKALERVLTGCYSKEVQPRSPSARGGAAFLRYLYGYNHGEKVRRLRRMLETTPADIQRTARFLLESMDGCLYQAAIVGGQEAEDESLEDWKGVRRLGILGESMR